MKINIIGKETQTGTLEKVKFDTETKQYMVGKYNCCGGDLIIQAISNKEVKDIIRDLQQQGYKQAEEI